MTVHAAPRWLFTALAAALPLGCGADLPSSSSVEQLRVLAVQKDAPYARPGQEVTLRMLWTDGRPEHARGPVQVAWFSGCFNPPGDSYFGCYPQLAQLDPRDCVTGSGGARCGLGDTFTFSMTPPGGAPLILPQRSAGLTPYGLAVVFFAACGGQLGPPPPGGAFPLGCYAPSGEVVGSEGFVAGYSSVYAYEDLQNANPSPSGLLFGGVPATTSCVDAGCLSPRPEAARCGEPGVPCISACADDGDTESCPGVDVAPLLDRSIVERDSAVGEASEEQIWVSYFATRGKLSQPLKLVNDATRGWVGDYGTQLHAPREPGPLELWAVVRDNRGGVGWTHTRVIVQP